MFKPQLKFQKILSLALLILSALVFFYAIGITTDVYPLTLLSGLGIYSEEEIQIFYDMQGYNKALVIFAIGGIVASVLPYIFSTNKRRKYYVDNYVGSGIQILTYIALAVFLIINSAKYKAEYLETINIPEYIEYCEEFGYFNTGTTIWFDLGFVCAALLFVASGLIVVNHIWKYKLEKAENAVLAGGVTNGK